MTQASITGSWGEEVAKEFLQRKGLRFITANWSCKLGEIDLIMQDGKTRVFVEVRTRRPTSYGEGLETVGPQKQGKLIRTAQAYQQKTNYWGAVRFDVISIESSSATNPPITHIPHAF